MKRWSLGQLAATLMIGAGIWAALGVACLFVGSTGDIGWPGPDALEIRRSHLYVASLVGAALAAAGAAFQAILRNPLADPYLLGVSSGATLSAYLWQLPGLSIGLMAAGGAVGQQVFAFAGAAVSVAVVFSLSSRRGRLEPVTLLLVGVIVNAINASIFLLLNAVVKEPARGGGPLSFLVGGLSPLTNTQWWAAGICIGAGWLVLFYLSGQLNVAGLEEGEAQALGVRIHRLRWIGLAVASLVTASAVAVSGPIGFIGLVCPHLARLLVGQDQRRVLPIATALGAGLLALADAASRWVAQSRVETTLPVGVLTGLLGGPFFLLLLWQSQMRERRV